MSNVCYIPLKGVDDVIGNTLGMSEYRIATLRGMYDETHTTPLNIDNIQEATKTIAQFRREIAIANNAAMNSIGTNLAPSYMKLRQAFTAEERFNRVNMIASMFSLWVDKIQGANPNLSRQQIVEGYTMNGKKVLGEFAIFERVYNQLLDMQASCMVKSNDQNPAVAQMARERAAKINQVLNNWSALTAFVRMKLRDTEGVKLGNRLEFADETNEGNYGDNNMSQLFSAEETTREGWQETNGMQSSFGSVGFKVRRILSSIPQRREVQRRLPDGRVVTQVEDVVDDLGCKVMTDPVKTHQALMEALRGVTSETQMVGALQRANQAWMQPIIQTLMNDPLARTQFFVDFKKNFQPYSILTEDKEYNRKNKGMKAWKTKLLNATENLLGGVFSTRIQLGTQVNPMTSIYNTDGSINWGNLQKTRELIKEWLYKDPKNPLDIPKFFQKGGSLVERRKFLRKASEALGIEVDADTLDKIMKNNKNLREYTKNLIEAVTFGIESRLTEQEKKSLDSGNFASMGTKSYKSLINSKQNAKDKKGILREKIDKMLTIITANREGLRLESRVRHVDSKGNGITLFSNINPSFLGDRMDLIQSYVTADDKKGLKRFLEKHYLSSSYFKDSTGKILNKWLEELYNCCNAKVPLSETFAAQFTYQRFLGTREQSFENFTGKQHMIDMFAEYFSDRQISSKATTALYPVFILGDSGVCKYIRAKRYDSKTILDGLFNVYRQEKKRQALVTASNQLLSSQGYSTIDNFSKTAETFTMLPFLNKDYKAADGTVGKYARMLSDNPSEAEVKKAISEYMKDALETFKQQLNNMGILETKTIKEKDKDGKDVERTRYVHLSKEATPETIDTVLDEYYWNTKFATIQQLQLMTIDTSFYKGTKDLQKRYKEIHAPGSVLSLQAIDTFSKEKGKKYSEDGIERVVYFDDISLNAELTNPEFMRAIEANFGKDSRYKAYLDNTLTDGQGYRTLRSYRKVMGMAGQWTQEMQNAYDEIEGLRTKYGRGEIPTDDLKRIADLAVIFQPIKPYMFTHEVLAVNATEKLLIPVQHKYAEAVLIPELLPHGSKLRDMAYWMDEHVDENGKSAPIDLIGSTKIVKVGGFGSTDISKANTTESLNEALGKGYVHQLSYADYRIQTNVPDHVQSARLFGTQVRKLIMANIDMGSYKYSSYIDSEWVNLGKHGNVRLNGRTLVSFYNSLIVANILQSFNKFEESISDPDKLSEQLIQTVINNSRESMDNILAYAMNDGEFSIPLFEAGLEHDASSTLLSMFKKMVNKQTIQGNPLVQVSAMGIDGYKEDGGLKYVTSEDGKNILYAECEIPWDLSYVDQDGNQVALDFNDYCNPDGTLKVDSNGNPLIEAKLPGVTSLVAYRIPTERDYSMLNLKVVRFSQKTAGGTIKVPVQGTTIAGFDFDVDKLYLMRREYKAKRKQSSDEATDNLLSAIFGQDTSALLEFEEYDFTKSPMENSRAARNNMLIHLIQQRLMDPETFEQRYTPGGFANASRSARIMRELMFGNLDGIMNGRKVNFDALYERANDKKSDPEPNYDPSDPMTIITYNQQNQVAGKLIGIFANQNTNHAFASLMKVFRLSSPIEFAGHSYSDMLHAPLDANGNPIDVDLNVAEFLSASVDAVKDPVLNFMNLNTITADAGAVLARIGYTTTEIGMLFNQPIIRELCEYCFNNGVGIKTALRDVKAKYVADGASVSKTIPSEHFSMDILASSIVADRKAREAGQNKMDEAAFASYQLEVLELFSTISSIANEVSQFVTSTKFTASNAVGSTFGDLYAQQMKVSKYLSELSGKRGVVMQVTDRLNTPLMNKSTLLSMDDADYFDTLIDNPFAYEQAMFDANRKALKALTKYFPYDTAAYAVARARLASLTESGTLDADTINSIHSDIMVYLLSNQERSDFNGNLPKNTQHGVMTTREYYTKHFVSDLYRELEANPSLKDLAIFKYMQFEADEETGEISMSVQGIGGLAPYQKDEIRESWSSLNSTLPLVARDLFLYNFYKLGFTFGPQMFMNLAPTEVKQALMVPNHDGSTRSYVEFMKDVMNGKFRIDPNDFAILYIFNHLDNKRLVYEVKGKKALDIIKPLAFGSGQIAQREFTLDISKLGKEDSGMFILGYNKEEKAYSFRPVLNIGGVYYVAQSGEFDFNVVHGTTMRYVKKDSLGTKNQSMQYNSISEVSMPNLGVAEQVEDGTTSQEPELTPPVTFDREAAITEIATEMAKALEKIGYRDEMGETISASVLMAGLANETDDNLKTQVEEIRKACREDGILLMDAEGNLQQGC